jgi:phosphohistidine phosphatase
MQIQDVEQTSMKTLILMRHAKSDWSQPGLTDHERPLNRRGCRAARLMGGYLNDSKIGVDLILASTAVRVQQTLELLQETWLCLRAEIITDHRLYLASSETIWNFVIENASQRESVMVVGHNPGIGELNSTLSHQFSPFPTAAVSIFADNSSSTQPSGANCQWCLVDFRRPRDLE